MLAQGASIGAYIIIIKNLIPMIIDIPEYEFYLYAINLHR
jgi:hypothetical protein